MNKRQDFVTLELSGERLESVVSDLRQTLLDEFWPDLPDGDKRRQISERLERNILASFDHRGGEIEAT